ncbi:MAG: hypothetical protein K0R23_2577 [Lacrimispora sp.]|jgi:frataxin-like iron-binding protein CyaY|nr:hypothetical protein [Lacrimispora sp.]
MQKYIKTLMWVLLFTFALTFKVNAQSLTDINDLIEKAKEYDGEDVTIQGEVIGESMKRGNYSWININDGTNAIGIWLDSDIAEGILSYGHYKSKGDTVKITGIFNRACKEHGGEADLHSSSFEIVKNGYEVKEQISPVKIIIAVILTLFALVLMLILVKVIKNRRL